MYRLTEEGKRYLRDGLPETNLANFLKAPLPIKEAREKIKNFNIALLWAKKNNWVKIEKGKLILLKEPTKTAAQEGLEMVSRAEELGDEILNLLLKRKLIEKETGIVTEAKKMIGKEITNLTPELIKTGLWKRVRLKPYNVTAKGIKIYPGKRQPYNHFLFLVRRKLVELGFREMTGPMIESEFWNFDALYQAQDHPSRDWAQTYTLKHPKHGKLPKPRIVSQVKATHENGWKTGSTGWGYKWDPKKASQLMPRAHGTACSARQLAKGVEIPGKYFAIKRCFRPDVIDATHGVEFNQVEGIVIDPSLTFKNLLGILKQFAIEFTGTKKVKFSSGYFPFTEPSAELYVKHPKMGWIESGGAGIFRPELTEPLGIDIPVIAWGLGIDRLAMIKLDIKDIRELFSKNLKWLREMPVI